MSLLQRDAAGVADASTGSRSLLPLIPMLVLPAFVLSGEIRLRVLPQFGITKDAAVAGMTVLAVVTALRHRAEVVDRIRPVAAPLSALGVLVFLYVVDPGGTRGTSWLFGTRLLVSALLLLVTAMVVREPTRWLRSTVLTLGVLLPFEAVFAWAQQAAGEDRLVYQWGYEFGAQVRLTSSGGLRTSGTFEDPFQLAALAVVGLAVALFVAPRVSRRLAWVIGVSSLAVLGATQVRTSFLQVGVLLVVLAVAKGYARQALVAGLVGVVAGVFVLATTTTAVRPGAPEKPLLLTLNGRSDAWANAVTGPSSLAFGAGVGYRGIGSTRTSTAVSTSPAYEPGASPQAVFAGDTAFLDSSYAQVLSDVGLVGVLALLGGFLGLLADALRRVRRDLGNSAAWAATALLLVTLLDWVGRASLASFSTGYLTMFVAGVLLAAAAAPRPPVSRPHRKSKENP